MHQTVRADVEVGWNKETHHPVVRCVWLMGFLLFLGNNRCLLHRPLRLSRLQTETSVNRINSVLITIEWGLLKIVPQLFLQISFPLKMSTKRKTYGAAFVYYNLEGVQSHFTFQTCCRWCCTTLLTGCSTDQSISVSATLVV